MIKKNKKKRSALTEVRAKMRQAHGAYTKDSLEKKLGMNKKKKQGA